MPVAVGAITAVGAQSARRNGREHEILQISKREIVSSSSENLQEQALRWIQ